MSSFTRTEIAAAAAETADAMYAFGYAMIEGERWQDARTVFQSMVLLCPRDERAWIALGRCHEAAEQEHVALELYSLGLLAVPRSVRCRVALARSLRRLGRDADAVSVLERALDIADELDEPTLVALVQKEAA